MNNKKVYVILTCRKYEGSWIEKIFSTEESAKNFLEENKSNTELKMEVWELDI